MGLDYEVIVVGAGPGGSTAAKFCAQAGLKTLLIEKERMPRYKPCGGCLSLKTVALLDFDLSPALETKVCKARFTYRLRDSFSIESKEPIAFMVERGRFDQFLVREASEKGAEVVEGTRLLRIEERREEVEVELSGGERVRSEYLIGADGAQSLVRKSLSLLPPKGEGNGMGIESEIPFESTFNFPSEDRDLIHLDFGGVPNGYAWVFPKKGGLSIGIAGMFRHTDRVNLRRYFDPFIDGLNYVQAGKVEKVWATPSLFFTMRGKRSQKEGSSWWEMPPT